MDARSSSSSFASSTPLYFAIDDHEGRRFSIGDSSSDTTDVRTGFHGNGNGSFVLRRNASSEILRSHDPIQNNLISASTPHRLGNGMEGHNDIDSPHSPSIEEQAASSSTDNMKKKKTLFSFKFGLRKSESPPSLKNGTTSPMMDSPSSSSPVPSSGHDASESNGVESSLSSPMSNSIVGRRRSEEIRPLICNVNPSPQGANAMNTDDASPESEYKTTTSFNKMTSDSKTMANHARIATFFANYADVAVLPDGTALEKRERKIKFASTDDVLDDEEEIESKAQIEIQREYELEQRRKAAHRISTLTDVSQLSTSEDLSVGEEQRPTTGDTMTSASDVADNHLTSEERRDLDMIAYELSDERMGSSAMEMDKMLRDYGIDVTPKSKHDRGLGESPKDDLMSEFRRSVRHAQTQTDMNSDFRGMLLSKNSQHVDLGIAPPIPPKDVNRKFSPPTYRSRFDAADSTGQMSISSTAAEEIFKLRSENFALREKLRLETKRADDETAERIRTSDAMEKMRMRYDKVSAQAFMALKRLVEDKRHLETELNRIKQLHQAK